MRVLVKLYATLREYAPIDSEIGASFEVHFDGRTLSELIQHLGFGLDRAKIVMINGIRVLDMSAILNEDDLIVIFPPLGGG
ncbi:MAG: molybdopterin synthase sulfur carrier subunit [Candidatus Thorarchaeota archaeon]|nr:MAG: molybdopterin synthase sulfur carrier subunit [Candidatus Thorarchaeota archaeon]